MSKQDMSEREQSVRSTQVANSTITVNASSPSTLTWPLHQLTGPVAKKYIEPLRVKVIDALTPTKATPEQIKERKAACNAFLESQEEWFKLQI